MEQKRRFTIGFIGLGHMGLAIARGAATKEYVERYEIAVYDPSVRTAKLCQEESFTQLNSEKEVAETCHIVLLAVTPQHIEEVLDHLKGADIQCLLSIVTGVSIGHLQENRTKPLADMIDEVCTKGGTTIEAIQSLKDQNLKNVFHEADEKCIHRAEELGNH